MYHCMPHYSIYSKWIHDWHVDLASVMTAITRAVDGWFLTLLSSLFCTVIEYIRSWNIVVRYYRHVLTNPDPDSDKPSTSTCSSSFADAIVVRLLKEGH